MNAIYIPLLADEINIGAEQVLGYPLKEVINVIFAVIVLFVLVDKARDWYKQKRNEIFETQSDQVELEQTVEGDHSKIDELENRIRRLEINVESISNGIVEVLKSDIMDAHDKCMSRTPHPYITRYERLVYITMYKAFSSLKDDDIINGFHLEMINLPVLDAVNSGADEHDGFNRHQRH